MIFQNIPIPSPKGFWDVNVGNIITIFSVLISIYGIHVANLKRFEQMDAKLNMIYKWFMETIVTGGGGNRPRRRNGD